MPELGPYGSVRGAAGNSRPYRERLHDDPIHTRRRQAYEKRQWTKSREAARLRCGGLYEGLIGTRTAGRVERRAMRLMGPSSE